MPQSQPDSASAPDCGANSDPCLDECCEPVDCPETDGDPGPDDHSGSDYREEPVRFSTGEVYLVTEDLAFKDFGVPWGHTRSYSNRVTEPGVGRNGNSWFVKEWPYLSPSDTSATPATICLEIQDVSGGAPWPIDPAVPHLALITDHELDEQGRIVQTLGPVHSIDLHGTVTSIRRARWTIYRDTVWQRWEADGFLNVAAGTFTLLNPIRLTHMDEAGRVLESIQTTRADTNGKLNAGDQFPQSTYVRWTVNIYSGHANVASRRVYFKIPASGPGVRHRPGVQNANFDETFFQYDIMRRVVRGWAPGVRAYF